MQFRKRKKKKKNHNIRTSSTSVASTNDPSKETKDLNASNINDNDADNDPEKDSKPNHPISIETEEEDDDLSFLSKLKETQTIQFKAKDKGLVFEENHEFTSSGLDNPDNFRHDPSKDFGESFSTEKLQDDKLKKNKEEWIQKQMRQRLLQRGRVLPQDEEKQSDQNVHKSSTNNTSLKEQLYALSDSLAAPLFQRRDNEEAGERWLAGMQEYELPLEYKLKNIEQTEDAKKKLLEPKKKRDKMFSIPRNYNQDFTTHHFDRVKSAEHKRKLQETQQQMSMEREKKRRRLMGTEWYTNTKTPQL